MVPIVSLARKPFTVETILWRSKAVRTGGPSGPVHDEWALDLRFVCEAPFRAAVFLDSDRIRLYARDWARHADTVGSLCVQFTPYNWENSDEVQVMAGGLRTTFESTALRVNPISATRLAVAEGTPGFTGAPMTIMRIPHVGALLGVILVASTDTKGDRTRWRVRDQHFADLGDFSFLSTGRRSGSVTSPVSP